MGYDLLDAKDGITIKLSFEQYVILHDNIDTITEKFATMFYELLIHNIQNNVFGLKNDPKTVKRKGSSVPLIDTRQYIKNIVCDGGKVYMKDGTHESGILFEDLTNILEYGRADLKIPAFPVWRLTLKQFQPVFEQELKRLLKNKKAILK